MPVDRIDLKLNKENKTEYLSSANSVELMPSIGEFKGYVELKTKVNSNFQIGDIIYICAHSGYTGVEYTNETYVLDNIIEMSGCTGTTEYGYKWYYHTFMKGYTIIGINDKKPIIAAIVIILLNLKLKNHNNINAKVDPIIAPVVSKVLCNPKSLPLCPLCE